MKSRFKYEMKYKLSDYYAINNAIIMENIVVFIFAVLIIYGLLIYYSTTLDSFYYVIIALILFPIFTYIIYSRFIKKTFKSSKFANKYVIEFEFFDDYFTVKNKSVNEQIYYEELHKIIENRKYFFLMLNNSMGYVIRKEELDKDSIKFLKEKNK